MVEHLPAVRAIVVAGLKKDGLNVADTGRRIDQNQEEGGDADDHDLTQLANAEDQHDQRKDRNLGQDVDC